MSAGATRHPAAPDLPRDLEPLALDALAPEQRIEERALSGLAAGSLANVAGRGVTGVRVLIDGARLTGLSLPECDLRDLVLRNCRADLASFARARMDRVTFEDCVLHEADFLDAELRGVRFVRCDLGGADFREARLTRCEMRSVRLAGAEGVERLRGTALPMADIVENTATWAAALGLRVAED